MKLANGKFEPSDHADEDPIVVVDEAPFDETSQQFFDCRSEIQSEGGKSSSEGGIPLKQSVRVRATEDLNTAL